MHSRTSGLSDYLAVDEMDALRIGRDIVAPPALAQARPGPDRTRRRRRCTTRRSCSAARRPTCGCRSTSARSSPGCSTAAGSRSSSRSTASQLVCGWGSICGFPVGILGNNGILFSEEAEKGAQFIQLCNRIDTPLVFFQNITGFMVGSKAEQGGIIKHGAKLINAVSNSTVPHFVTDGRRQLRRRQLRHVGQGLRPAVHLHVAEPPHRRDGTEATRRRDGHRRPQRRRRPRGRGRRGGARRADRRARGADRRRVDGAVRDRARLGRRDHPPARHADGARRWRCRPRTATSSRAPASTGSGGTDDPTAC